LLFVNLRIVLSTPLGLADHKGRHKVRSEFVAPGDAETPAAGIPSNRQKLGLQNQSAFFCRVEHC